MSNGETNSWEASSYQLAIRTDGQVDNNDMGVVGPNWQLTLLQPLPCSKLINEQEHSN